MTSLVWSRTTEDAFSDPYEYLVEKQFRREAHAFLSGLMGVLATRNATFKAGDQSLEKAQWMLANDAVQSALDCLDAIEVGKHRIASKLFRCMFEGMDRLQFFSTGTQKAKASLGRWYQGGQIHHRDIREWIEVARGPSAKEASKKAFGDLSQFLHGAYRALLDGYSRGKGDRMIYDGCFDSAFLVPRQTLSVYHVVLAQLITRLHWTLAETGTMEPEVLLALWRKSLETHTVPRRFSAKRRAG